MLLGFGGLLKGAGRNRGVEWWAGTRLGCLPWQEARQQSDALQRSVLPQNSLGRFERRP